MIKWVVLGFLQHKEILWQLECQEVLNEPLKLIFKEYYNEDIPKNEYTYAKGMKNGPFKEYYDQGEWVIEERPEGQKGEPVESVRILKGVQIQRSGKYVNDLLEGEVSYFRKNGHSDKIEMYKEGVLLKK